MAIFCPYCGKEVKDKKISCPYCGHYSAQALDKWTAFFLCLFLGGFGAHKFYERRIGIGVVYILTGGLLGVGVLIDLIVILTKPNPYFIDKSDKQQ